MNLPNKLTLLRILLVIPFITLMSLVLKDGAPNYDEGMNSVKNISFLVSGIIFALAMITDWFDGYLARKNKQVTTFGKLFDPLADKIMTTSAMIFLSLMGIVPFWITIIFILRDVLVDGFRNLAATKKIDVSASFYGKAKTMVQSIGIVIVFIIYPIFASDFGSVAMVSDNWKLYMLNIPLIIASLLSVISGYLYYTNSEIY